MKVAFDLDGTLVENVPFEAYENDDLETLANAVPIHEMVAYARVLQSWGVSLVIITGRHNRVNAATRKVLDKIGFANVPLVERKAEKFDLVSAVHEKAAALRLHKPKFFVGDRDDLDGAAARLAKVEFFHIDTVRSALKL